MVKTATDEASEFSLAEFIELAESSKTRIQIELSRHQLKKSVSNIYLIALYMRASEIFDGIIVLAKSRVPVCGYILNRTLSECFAFAKACVKDPEFYRTAMNKHLKEKAKRVASVRRDLSKLPFSITDSQLEEIESFNRNSVDSEFKILSDNYQLFAANSLESLYHQVFAHCSLFTHNDSHTLDRYVDAEGVEISAADHFVSDSILNLMMATKIYFEFYLEMIAAAGSKPEFANDFTTQFNAAHDRASVALAKK